MRRLLQDKYTKWYLSLDAGLFTGVLVMQMMDLREAEDFFVWLCIAVNAVFMLRSSLRIARYVMLLTFLADTLLVLLDRRHLLGVLLFCIVQTLYAWYLYTRGVRMLLLRVILFVMPLLLLIYYPGFDAGNPGLIIPAVFSFSQLLVNTICSLRMAKRTDDPEDKIFAAEMLLFFGCDVCVGLRNLPVPLVVQNLAYILNWIFYVPSQVLLTIHLLLFSASGRNIRCRR